MICKNCKMDWSDVGYQKKRVKTGYLDHMCSNCGSRKAPVKSRVLVVPDLHFSFQHPDYLHFLKDMYEKWECNTVVHLGDLWDNHVSSYHESDPDGMGAGKELDLAIKETSKLLDTFPDMKLVWGNHCSIPSRKAYSAGLSSRWVKSIKEVLTDHGLDVSGWEWSDHWDIEGVRYTHGTGRAARNRMKEDGISVVQGHFHSKTYIDFLSNERFTLFAMQLGCLINKKEYAFKYGKNFSDPHLNCGVVLDGTTPIVEWL